MPGALRIGSKAHKRDAGGDALTNFGSLELLNIDASSPNRKAPTAKQIHKKSTCGQKRKVVAARKESTCLISRNGDLTPCSKRLGGNRGRFVFL